MSFANYSVIAFMNLYVFSSFDSNPTDLRILLVVLRGNYQNFNWIN